MNGFPMSKYPLFAAFGSLLAFALATVNISANFMFFGFVAFAFFVTIDAYFRKFSDTWLANLGIISFVIALVSHTCGFLVIASWVVGVAAAVLYIGGHVVSNIKKTI